MSILLRRARREQFADLRHETTDKWVRAIVGGEAVADTTGALLVWEPRRVVPSYAVPVSDVRAELVPAPSLGDDGRPVLHPLIPFAYHSTPGESFTLRTAGRELPSAAFRPADPALAGHVVLDFAAFDAWYEEDVRLLGHPCDLPLQGRGELLVDRRAGQPRLGVRAPAGGGARARRARRVL